MFGLWVGCGAPDQCGFCQAKGTLYESFLQQQCLLPSECPQKKGEGGSDKSIVRVLSSKNGKNLLLFTYFTAGSLPGICMCV